MSDITNHNYVAYAVKNYTNPRCLSADEFFEDLARFKYVKRLLNRYLRTGVVQERLVVNHIISIYNVFDSYAASELLFSRCIRSSWPALVSILKYIDRLPEGFMVDVEGDAFVTKRLEEM